MTALTWFSNSTGSTTRLLRHRLEQRRADRHDVSAGMSVIRMRRLSDGALADEAFAEPQHWSDAPLMPSSA